MTGFIHLLSSVMVVACALAFAVGAVVFLHNVLRKDPDYEVRFPWWVRLSLYFVIFVVPPLGWLNGAWLNGPWWVHLLLYLIAFAIPLVGLLGSLWLGAFRKTRERVKLAKGLLLASLVPIVLLIGTSVDPNSRVTDCVDSMFHPATYQRK
jgi:hypothetical protein